VTVFFCFKFLCVWGFLIFFLSLFILLLRYLLSPGMVLLFFGIWCCILFFWFFFFCLLFVNLSRLFCLSHYILFFSSEIVYVISCGLIPFHYFWFLNSFVQCFILLYPLSCHTFPISLHLVYLLPSSCSPLLLYLFYPFVSLILLLSPLGFIYPTLFFFHKSRPCCAYPSSIFFPSPLFCLFF